MKKYFTIAISFALGIGAMKAYESIKEKESLSSIIPKYSSEDDDTKQSMPVPIYVVSEETPVVYETIPAQETIYTTNINYDLVNEEVFLHLSEAYNNMRLMYLNGEVSSQMMNNNIQLSQGDSKYVDENMKGIYYLISSYVNFYRENDLYSCSEVARQIFNYQGISKSDLYNILVSRKLPVECQSSLNYHNVGGIYDNAGNIVLDNGRILRLIGGEDSIISNDDNYTDTYNRMIQLSKWYETLPMILFDQYASIQNVNGNDGVCYVWNQTMVERSCNREWNMIKQDGQSRYGFNSDTTSVIWDPNFVSYVFEDINGQHFLLDDLENARVDHIFDVQDAIVSGVGDPYFLDNYEKNMRTYQDVYQYSK